jgi:hypothetical protein
MVFLEMPLFRARSVVEYHCSAGMIGSNDYIDQRDVSKLALPSSTGIEPTFNQN